MTRSIRTFAILVALATPSWSQVSVVGDLSQMKEARPGETYDGVILVKNDTPEIQEAKVYQHDYSFHFSGTNTYGDPGSSVRSNARWIAFSPAFVTLPPNATVAVNFTVSVPRDTTGIYHGTYWSMLMVEGVRRGSAESSRPGQTRTEMGISQTIRYGIQIATSIAGTGAPNVNFIDSKLLNKDDGSRILQVDVENSGDRYMRPEAYVELFDEYGLSRGRYSTPTYRLYPGTSVRYVFDISSAPKGTYKALVVVDAGGDEAFAAQYTLQL